MTKLPTGGGAWTRDGKGALKRTEAPTAQKPARKPAPPPKPEQKDADT